MGKRTSAAAAVLLALSCALVQLASGVAAAALALESSKASLAAGPLQFSILATPKQPAIKHVTVETLVDTTGTALVSDLKVKGDGEKFVVSLDGDSKLPAGMYKMKVSAFDNDTQTTTTEVLQLKVTVPVVIASAEVNGADVAFGDKLDVGVLSAGSNDALQIQVQLQAAHDKTPVTAHQAVLRFSHVDEKVDTYFLLPADKASKTHGALLHFSVLSSKFAYKSGVHSVELIVGDPTFESAVVWDLGTVELELAAAPPVPPSPLYTKPLLHESDTTLKALPEITHVMRPQDPRPPITVSLAFTAAVLVPLVAFLLFTLKLQLNLRKLFQASVLPFGVVFLASLAAILALFAWYWLELTMFRTLGYLSGLSTVTLWSGHLTLKRLAQQSVGKKSKSE